MHEMVCHAYHTVLEYGLLAKFSSQGFEAMHQLLKQYSHQHSDKSVAHTCGTVLTRIVVMQNPDVVLSNTKGKVHGGVLESKQINRGHLASNQLEKKRKFQQDCLDWMDEIMHKHDENCPPAL